MKRIVAAAAALLLAFLLFAPAVMAADPALPHNGRIVVSTEGDVNVAADEHYDAIVVVKGTATVAGEVNTIVVVDGALKLTGATTESIVAVRSPITVGDGSVVLGDVMKIDSVVTRIGDAQVQGSVRDVALDAAGIGFFLGSAMLLLYIGFGIAAIAAGLLLAGIAARQVRAAEEVIRREPVQAFFVGFFGMFVPLIVAIVLFFTIVGAPLGLGILLGLWPLAAFVGYLVTAIFVGDWVLTRTSSAPQPERPYLAAIIGVVILEVLGIWPFLTGIATMFGYGAVLMLVWRTLRRQGGAVAVRQPIPQPAAG